MPTCSVQSACADGRAQNPRFIQRQLRRLYDALVQNAAELMEAAMSDGQLTANEALLELSIALREVRQHFIAIEVRRSLEDEYSIARGQDWRDRRVPVGIVYIRPLSHTLLYSVVSPLSAAVAAGNCVVVELENSLLGTTSVLRRLLATALDQDTFNVVHLLPDTLPSNSILVDQVASQAATTARKLNSLDAHCRVVALVDRTANIGTAATEIVQMRAAFRGRSPYAPDLILVNEFAIQDFLQAAVQAFTQHGFRSHAVKSKGSQIGPRARKPRDAMLSEEERSDPDTTVIFEGDEGRLVVIGNRKLPVLKKKIRTSDIIIHPVSSLDDAVDFANSFENILLASYHFAALPAAKYTSQFIHSCASFINSIPVEFKVGPSAPTDFAVSPSSRYTTDMLSIPSPQYVKPSVLTDSLQRRTGKAQQNERIALEEILRTPLSPDDQRAGKTVGFFDQGLITGATLLLTPIVGGIGVASYYGIRGLLRVWGSRK